MPSIFRSDITIDVEDLFLINKHSWHIDSVGYIATRIDGKLFRLHKLLFPEYKRCDHIDGNKLNNRRINLREVTAQQNVLNRGISNTNTSGYKGVCWHTIMRRYRAYITYNNKQIYLGVYINKHVAAKAYNDAAIKYFGQFARLNIIKEHI